MDTGASDRQRRDLRLGLAQRQIPEILGWAGVLTLIFGFVNFFAIPDLPAFNSLINVTFGPLFIWLAWAIRRGTVPMTWVPWVWASSATLLVALLVNAFRMEPNAANLAYMAVVMTAFGPVTHAWWPFAVASSIMLVLAVLGFALASWPGGDADVLVCVAAIVVSAFLLRLRLLAVNALADSNARLERQALLDAMTDTLNRTGLARAVPGLLATAERSDSQVLAWFVDVRGLKEANDRFGHRFGDRVIVAVAEALKSGIRSNDLLVRWGGDEFVVLGTGREGSADDLNARVDAILSSQGLSNDSWNAGVTVGFASGTAPSDVLALVSAADEDMYRRRGVG